MNVEQVEQLLEQLQTTLDELATVQEEKERALAVMDTAALETLAQREGQLAEQMSRCSQQRQQLVAFANQSLQTKVTFRELLEQLPVPQRGRLISKFDQVRAHAKQVKQRAAANWFATYRTNQHVKDLIEIIATAGTAADGESGYHGLFLDSTA